MKSLALLVLPMLALPAAAQSLVPGPNQPGRYEMQPVPGGVARLDTVTGDVSLCRVEDGALRCRPSEDDDTPPAGEGRRSDFSDRDERGGDHDMAPRFEERGDADADRDRRPDARADADVEVDKAIRRMKKLFHAFGDIARDWEGERGQGSRDSNGGDRSDEGPDRT